MEVHHVAHVKLVDIQSIHHQHVTHVPLDARLWLLVLNHVPIVMLANTDHQLGCVLIVYLVMHLVTLLLHHVINAVCIFIHSLPHTRHPLSLI
jgi:hypothetical protein